MNSSESSTAICAARPISVFAVFGNAWCTSYRMNVKSDLANIGVNILWTISLRTKNQCFFFQFEEMFSKSCAHRCLPRKLSFLNSPVHRSDDRCIADSRFTQFHSS